MHQRKISFNVICSIFGDKYKYHFSKFKNFIFLPYPSSTCKYKAYRNTLNRLLRRAESNYYHSVLNEHKGNSKKAWETVNELIYNKKRSSSPPSKLMNSNGEVISNPLAIAEEFNEFFTNVGKTMATFLPAVGSNNSKNIVFSKNKANNSIFLLPCSPQEVHHLQKKKSQTSIRHRNKIYQIRQSRIIVFCQ